ncbi:hypothetical protein HPB47_018570 [Ixodes persulcatus]|uniref:Uncharacterized protein n=1 Tax=Ixodes persulcatus TaxID=34615 RepID=A0AC60QMY9_IXOPE|nr:hypothetical protein HPB47_018570 [Ixodes persulcatus]
MHGEALLEGSVQLLLEKGIGVARGVTDLQEGRTTVLVTNFREEPQHLTKGTTVGYVEELQAPAVVTAISEETSSSQQESTTPPPLDIDPELPAPKRRQMVDLLAEYSGRDVHGEGAGSEILSTDCQDRDIRPHVTALVGLNCACTELLTWMELVVGGRKAITSCSSRLLKMQHPAAEHLGSTQHRATAQSSRTGGDNLNHTHAGERWCSFRSQKGGVGLNCACTELLTWMELVVGGGKAITSCSSRLLKMQHPAAEHLGSTQHRATAQSSRTGGDNLNHTHAGERWCSFRRCYVRGITLRPWPTVLDAVDDTTRRFLGLGLRSRRPSSSPRAPHPNGGVARSGDTRYSSCMRATRPT